jgi:hypothetical protein
VNSIYRSVGSVVNSLLRGLDLLSAAGELNPKQGPSVNPAIG